MQHFLEVFATDQAVAMLEKEVVATSSEGQLSAMVALSWQLRQRDAKRSLALSASATNLLEVTDLSDLDRQALNARIQLIVAESRWLHSELEAGRTIASSALLTFKSLGDPLGSSDAHALLAGIAYDLGDTALYTNELKAAAALAETIDPVRVTLAHASIARSLAFTDPSAAKKLWQEFLPLGLPGRHPAAECVVEEFWGIVTGVSSDHVQSIRHLSIAYLKALETGQIRRAIYTALNIGESHLQLNDYQSTIEWTQRALDLARASEWPSMMGNTLGRMANALRRLQQSDAAAALLRESLELMTPVSGSRNYAIALKFLGEVELDLKQFGRALDTLRQLELHAAALNQSDLVCDAFNGQARALLELGEVEAAMKAAETALNGAQNSASQQISALRTLAAIHSRHAIPRPADVRIGNPPLHYLERALSLAKGLESYTIPDELLDELAREYAKLGDTAKAYALALEANTARTKIHNTQVANRASAMQVAHETEKIRAEAEHHRQLAMASSERAKALEQSNAELHDQLEFKSEELERVDSSLTQVRADYEKAHPMAMMASTIPGVAHDLNTPVSNANMAASTMRDQLEKFQAKVKSGALRRSDLDSFLATVSEGLDIIERANSRAAELVSNLKELSIDQASQRRRTFTVDKIIDEVLSMLAPSLKNVHVRIVRDVSANLTMDSFPGPLGQVIANLIQNTVVHGFEGKNEGTVTLGAHLNAEGVVRIEVTDDGVGMSEEIRSRMFEPFFTTKLGRGGSGVGLSLCQRLVEEVLHGSIAVESKAGHGTRFIILLPQFTPNSDSASTHPA